MRSADGEISSTSTPDSAGAHTELFPSAQASPMGLENPTTPPPPPPPPPLPPSHPTCPQTLHTSSSSRLWSYSRQRHRPHLFELLGAAESGAAHPTRHTAALLHLSDHFSWRTWITVETPTLYAWDNPVYQRPPPTEKEQLSDLKGTHARGQWFYTFCRLRRFLSIIGNPYCITIYSP